MVGIRIGEAANPGPSCLDASDDELPPLCFDESEDDLEPFLQPPDLHAEPEDAATVADLPALTPTWMGDFSFSDDQLPTWREAERKVGLNEKLAAAKAAKGRATILTVLRKENFLKAAVFSGQCDGFSFKTGPKGLGYYREGATMELSTVATTLCLDELVPKSACTQQIMDDQQPISWRPKRPARRARRPDGSRIRAADRRHIANACLAASGQTSCPVEQSDTIEPKSAWWKKRGYWALETFNANAWRTFEKAAVGRSKADFLFGQETKVFTADACRRAQRQARKLGWNPTLSLAHQTAEHSASGGGAILARAGIGIVPVDKLIPDALRHRLHLSKADAIVKGGLHTLNTYLISGEGLSVGNLDILQAAAVCLKALKGPWVAAGDWNITPAMLTSTQWLKMVGGVIIAPELPTCNANVYDFFVVHKSLAHAVVGIQRLHDGGCHPHYPVRLLLRGNARRYLVRRLVKPPLAAGELPAGPPNRPPSYIQTQLAIQKGDLHEATMGWYSAARAELTDLAGTDLSHKQPYFKWAPAVSEVTPKDLGETRLSRLWRVAACGANEIGQMLVNNGDSPTQWKSMQGILLRAGTAHHALSKTARAEHAGTIANWTAALHHAIRIGATQMVASLVKVAKIKAGKIEAAAFTRSRIEWQVALGATASKPGDQVRPTKLAYRWLRGLEGWQPSTVACCSWNRKVATEDGDGTAARHDVVDDDDCYDDVELDGQEKVMLFEVPLSDQAVVDKEAAQWAELWQAESEYHTPDFGNDIEQLQPLLVVGVREAARTFPIHTGLGADNLAPRAVARLSDDAIHMLCLLFMAFEATGGWCQALNLVLIVLLPKSDGGRRPIGLFCTLIRVWMRARLWAVRKWEAANALPGVFAGPEMGAQKAAWQAAFAAESANLAGFDYGQALLDLVKAFETVPHDVLVSAAREAGYPLALLRLSLAAYRLARSIGIDGIFSALIMASRGITAGSGFATSELKALLRDLMILLKARWPELLDAKLYVDDLTLGVSGPPQVVIDTLAEAIDFTVEVLEVAMKMAVSGTKSKVLASRPSIAQAIIEATASSKVKVAGSAKMLGVDTVAGARRTTTTFRNRLTTFTSTIDRMHQLRDMGVNTVQMTRTAGVPMIMYGCEVFGVSDSALDTVRSRVANGASTSTAGKNAVLTLTAIDGEAGTLDPSFEAHVGPVKHWALCVWGSWFPVNVLQDTLTAAKAKVAAAAGSPWSAANGPTTALCVTLTRLGWSMVDYCTLVNDLGTSVHLELDSPMAVASLVKDSVRRWRWKQVADILPGLVPSWLDSGTGAPTQRDTIVGCFASIGRLLKGKLPPKLAGAVGALWEPKCRGDLHSAVIGGQWSQVRKAAVTHFGIDDKSCQLCREAPGTIGHRFNCAKTKPVDGWPAAPKGARLALDRIGHRRREILQHRGLAVVRLPPTEFDQEGRFQWLLPAQPNEPKLQEATWYFDGSMLHRQWKALRVTGFGVAVVSAEGDLLAYGLGWPPTWCSTAAAAEAWALQYIISCTPFPPKMKTDCLSLVTTCMQGTHRATHHSRVLARVWIAIGKAIDVDITSLHENGRLIWVPAHKSISSVGEAKCSDGSRLSMIDWRANRLVDALAKLAAGHQQVSEFTTQLLTSADAAVSHSACLLGVVTHAANNFRSQVTLEGGQEVTKVLRDSSDKPRTKRATSSPPVLTPKAASLSKPASVAPVAAWKPLSAAAAARREVLQQAKRRVEEIGSSSTRAAPEAGSVRLARLAARVRARL